MIHPTVAADPKSDNVLFVGNSFTYFFGMPQLVSDLAAAMPEPRQVYCVWHTRGGWTLEDHWADETGRAKIAEALRSHPWKAVVLQKWQSAEEDEDLSTYLDRFVGLIRRHQPKARIVIYQTEAPAVAVDEQGGERLISVPDLDAIDRQYREAAARHDLVVAPASRAWLTAMRQRRPALQWVWKSRDSHPSSLRQYLTACLVYAAIYDESPSGSALRHIGAMTPQTNPFGMPKQRNEIPDELAAYMQALAWRTFSAFAAPKDASSSDSR